MSTPPKIDYGTFEYLRKVISQVHNRNVRREFLDVDARTPDGSPRKALNLASLIRPGDPVGTMMLRMELFYFALGHIDKLATVAMPEVYDVRKIKEAPQLVTIWRPSKTGGQWSVSIPHYDGQRRPTMPASWTKGNHVGTTWMTDNTYIRIYAATEAELDKMLNHFHAYINPAMISHTSLGKRSGAPIREVTLHPTKAEYYEKGRGQIAPTWVCYFDKDGNSR